MKFSRISIDKVQKWIHSVYTLNNNAYLNKGGTALCFIGFYAAATAATPGPDNIMSMSNGSRFGFRRAVPSNLGIGVGFSIVMLLCTVFCSLLSAFIPKIKLPVCLAYRFPNCLKTKKAPIKSRSR